ncbi:MAG: DUF2157 domain-containing protein [Pseudomonadota bacterium]|nr:DUF2157 domain-containing protein [Pseudomonadota bacterium]
MSSSSKSERNAPSAQITQLQALHAAGLLSDAAFKAAYAQLRSPHIWLDWLRQICLLIGTALLVLGILFFFAYNWAALPRLVKLGSIQLGILLCGIAALYVTQALIRQLLLTTAAVLVGVLLVVFGQVYQTGADAYNLFVTWAALILIWVVVARFAALWVIWLLIAQLALGLYWQQLGQHQFEEFSFAWLLLGHLSLSSLILLWHEWAQSARASSWLQHSWPNTSQGHAYWLRPVLLIGVLLPLNLAACWVIFESANHLALVAWLLTWLVGSVALHQYYWRQRPDVLALGLIILGICVTSLVGMGRVIAEVAEHEAVIFGFAVMILAVVSLAAWWLKKLAHGLSLLPHTEEDSAEHSHD